jgi:hypothetical protein
LLGWATSRVEVRQQRAFIDRIALIDEHFGNPPADAKAKPHLPNVDVSIERQMVVQFMRSSKVRGKVEPPRSRPNMEKKLAVVLVLFLVPGGASANGPVSE